LHAESFKRGKSLEVNSGIGLLSLAVELESGAGEVEDSVVTRNKCYYFWREEKVVFCSFGRI